MFSQEMPQPANDFALARRAAGGDLRGEGCPREFDKPQREGAEQASDQAMHILSAPEGVVCAM